MIEMSFIYYVSILGCKQNGLSRYLYFFSGRIGPGAFLAGEFARSEGFENRGDGTVNVRVVIVVVVVVLGLLFRGFFNNKNVLMQFVNTNNIIHNYVLHPNRSTVASD